MIWVLSVGPRPNLQVARISGITSHRRRFATRADARTAIFDYIESFYNRSRRHSSLGYQSPLDYESSLS